MLDGAAHVMVRLSTPAATRVGAPGADGCPSTLISAIPDRLITPVPVIEVKDPMTRRSSADAREIAVTTPSDTGAHGSIDPAPEVLTDAR